MAQRPSARRPVLIFSVFLGAALAVALGPRRHRTRPWERPDSGEMARFLQSKGLPLRAVPQSDFSRGLYLTATDKSHEELACLPRARRFLPQWQGTVYCERVRDPSEYDDPGEGHLCIGGFMFFGDPKLLEAIARAMRE